MLKRSVTILLLCLVTILSFGQVSGTVVDRSSGEPLMGATIVQKATKSGTVTGFDGTFELKKGEIGDTLIISYLGYISKTLTSQEGMFVELQSGDISLAEISVIANIAVDRKTPVASSTVSLKEIQEVYGSRELPEVLNMTPAVYATKSGGGIGDSRINIRGFDQRNVAVMINGIPVNDMENGWVYWSNWAGLGDAVSRIQVQRGLGASKLAINSVGGTINLITKSTEAEQSSFGQIDMTSYGRTKVIGGYNSGRMKDNSAFSLVLSTTQGSGYVEGTDVNAFSYFLSYSKEFGDNHRLVLTGIGAPQQHGQRDRMLTREDVNQFGSRHNMDLGYLAGEELNQRTNYYHKPQFALNHYWDINNTTSLNTSTYFSFGHGGGSGPLGRFAPTDDNGHIDWDGLVAANYTNGQSVGILRNSVNNHRWAGVLSTLEKKVNNFDITLGLDARDYKGEHFREVRNLLGGDSYFESYRFAIDGVGGRNQTMIAHPNASSYWDVTSVTPADQRIAYDNDGIVRYLGGFSQVEYTSPDQKWNAFVAGSLSTTSNKRIDRYNYLDPEDQVSETVNIGGYNAKIGANYNIDDQNNVFVNAGKYSRAPFFGFLFQNFANQLTVNSVNEKVDALELGYAFKNKVIAAKVNGYITKWSDKTLLSGRIPTADGGTSRALIQGIGALHKGIEVEINAKPTDKLDVGGIASIGDWEWRGDVAYELQSDIDQSITRGFAYTDGLPVGNAPQTQIGAKGRYQLSKMIDFGATYVYNGRLYADYDPSSYTSLEAKADPYQLDSYGMLDARIGIKVGKKGYLQVQGYNLLGFDGFVEGVNNGNGTDIAYGFPAWGTNYNVSYNMKF